MECISHRMVHTNGINMHIAEQGSGPLVVLIHGFPDLWYSWRHQIPALAKAGYHVVAPDLRGFGQSEIPSSSSTHYTYLHVVGDIIGLLDALAAPKAFIVGHDWGSIIAYNLALFCPDRVIALVNVSVPYTPRVPGIKPVEKFKASFGEEYYVCRFQEPGKAEAEFMKYDYQTIMKKFLVGKGPKIFAAPFDKGIIDVLEVPKTLPCWITEEDIQYYAKAFEKTGFTGGLNYYRALDLSWELTAPWTEAKLSVPTKYIVGDEDLVYNTPGMEEYIHGDLNKYVPFLKELVTVKGAHHFIQQERSKLVTEQLFEFFERFSAQ